MDRALPNIRRRHRRLARQRSPRCIRILRSCMPQHSGPAEADHKVRFVHHLPSHNLIHRRYLDVHALIHWVSAQQRAPESGFAGRTNKLVDGCYSHWVGGCWSLLNAAVGLVTTDLWSRDGLARFVLSCCQNPRGGLRDKPSKAPDAYHSCYCLAGLGAAQHVFEYVGDDSDSEEISLPLTSPFQWKVKERTTGCWTDDDVVEPVHPVFVIAMEKVEECRQRYRDVVGF
jgi:protein farnesyltransferase subunit beta